MHKLLSLSLTTAVLLTASVLPSTSAEDLPIPAQDQGLPYTRSAHSAAKEAVSPYIVLHPLSKYAWVYGHKTRIDNQDILRGDPIVKKGDVYVPVEFAGVVKLSSDFSPDAAPQYLENRWIYELSLPETAIPKSVKTLDHKGRIYVDLMGLAKSMKLACFTKGDLQFIGPAGTPKPSLSDTLQETIVSQFDTPEKYTDPKIATKYIPQLKRQGVWTEHAKVSKKEIKLLDGPEPEWPVTPKSEYNFQGFNKTLLGSNLPAPGVYPRLLFSEEDLPAIRQRIASNRIAQKSQIEIEALLAHSWLDPTTSDGQVFDKLASGDTDSLTWDAWQGGRRIPSPPGRFDQQKPGIYSSHISYNTQCLTAIALHALLTDDDELGQKTARAITNIYRLHDANLDRFLEFSDSELGSNPGDANASTTHWRGIHGTVAHMDLPFSFDFAGKWMSDEDKEFMSRFIAKATYGRRTGGGDGPRRNWRDINHVTWHMTHALALMTIEGHEGFDPEAYASGIELIGDFLEWGLNENGIMYESNGKSSGGLQFQVLNMIAAARRGENFWGHPHWRKMAEAQVLNTSPSGGTSVSSGTWSGGLIAMPTMMMFHAFYPEDRFAEQQLTLMFDGERRSAADPTLVFPDDLEKYREQLMAKPGRTRLPSVNYPGFSTTLLYDLDWESTKRGDLDAPLDYIDDNQGILSSYSENDASATWMHLLVRSNHYSGSGHHHADAGMFHFGSDGVDWVTESQFQKVYDGRFHNQVLIDGIAEPNSIQGRALWAGAATNEHAAFVSTDLTQSYTWRRSNQFIYFDTDDWGPRPDQYEWTLSKDPLVIEATKGTQRYKMRPWWPTGVFSNWYPVLQRPYNPVEYVWRSAGLVRGEQPYGVILDDVKKDDEVRLYQWSAMPGPGVWAARSDVELPLNMLLLAKSGSARMHANEKRLRPRKGDAQLLVCVLGGEGAPAEFEHTTSKGSRFALNPYAALAEGKEEDVAVPVKIETRADGPHWANTDQVQFFYDQIIGGCYSKQARFRTLLIPCKAGEPLPDISYDAAKEIATITWANQTDTLKFKVGDDQRTRMTIRRGEETIVELK